VTLHCW